MPGAADSGEYQSRGFRPLPRCEYPIFTPPRMALIVPLDDPAQRKDAMAVALIER